jgi:predicted Zn-dependent protease
MLFWGKNTGIYIYLSIEDVSGDKDTFKTDDVITIYYANEGWKKDQMEYTTKDRPSDVVILATTLANSKDVFISNSIFARIELASIMAHEFGHVLGCMHTNNENDIMYPYLTYEPQAPTKFCIMHVKANFL